MTTIAEITPSKTRKAAYILFAIVSAVATGGTVGFAAIGQASPAWLLFATAFIGSVGTALGFVAAGNTPTLPPTPTPDTSSTE